MNECFDYTNVKNKKRENTRTGYTPSINRLSALNDSGGVVWLLRGSGEEYYRVHVTSVRLNILWPGQY